MLYQVTEINFDFQSDCGSPTVEEQREIVASVMSGDWEADSEDDLIESITDETGWCVNTVRFKVSDI
jgi:hypothetical protein